MSILNYFFIGVGFTFIIDALLFCLKTHPPVQRALKNWGLKERIVCIALWPVSVIIFLITFFQASFKK